MSTMYSRSYILLNQAKEAVGKISEDDAYLDIACFETQQAVEFLLKTILQEYGVAYEKTHNIRYLLDLVKSSGFVFDKEDDFDILADTLTDWEQSSRYGKGVKTTINTILRMHNIYNSMNQAFIGLQESNNK